MVGTAAKRHPPVGGSAGAGPDWHARGAGCPERGGCQRSAHGAADCPPATERRAAPSPRAGRTHMTAPRLQLADELLRRLAAALRSAQLYSKGHPIIGRNLESLSTALQLLHSLNPTVVVGIVGDEIVVDDMPMTKGGDTFGPLIKRLQQGGVERVTIDRGVTNDELRTFIEAVSVVDAGAAAGAFPVLPHVRVGRVTTEQRVEGSLTDMATIRQL